MTEHDDPTRGEAAGDEPAIEDPTREPSAGIDERLRAHRIPRLVKQPQDAEDASGTARPAQR